MKPSMEAPQSHLEGASLVSFERVESSFPWSWHYHPEFELTLIEKGRGMRLVGDHSERYAPLDLVLLGPDLPHTWSSAGRPRQEGNKAIVVQFRKQMLPEAVLALPEFATVHSLLSQSARGIRFSEETAREIRSDLRRQTTLDGVAAWLGLAGVLARLATAPRTLLASAGHRHHRSVRLSSRLERVTAYLEKHYRDDIDVRHVSKMIGLTPTAFSRFFRKMTHRTFIEYRNGLRIREVCRLLTESDYAVTEIAHDCGFHNLANFNRRFLKEKGISPRQFRLLHNP